MIKTQEMSENGETYTAGNNIYTAASRDGTDKSHLCSVVAKPALKILIIAKDMNLWNYFKVRN